MESPNIKDLPIIQNFEKDRGELEKDILKLPSLTGRSNMCLHISRLYKTIAENTENEKIRKDAMTEAEYFLQKAVKHGGEYLFQKEMLPKYFNVDKPI